MFINKKYYKIRKLFFILHQGLLLENVGANFVNNLEMIQEHIS